jgi:hypothetical protein
MDGDDRLTLGARTAYRLLAWAFVGCVAVQLFLVGLDVFHVLGPDTTIHRSFAYLYGWLAPALVLLGGIGRLPRRLVELTVLLLVLFALQTYLPALASRAPLVAAFHAVNALGIAWLAVHLARSGPRGVPNSVAGG